tara:strand:- start:888 stop:1082 length:195 start_codon:yes stop_codon:yes gene_type:complete
MKDLDKNKNECDNARKLYIALRDACYIARRDNPALHALHADLANYSFNDLMKVNLTKRIKNDKK